MDATQRSSKPAQLPGSWPVARIVQVLGCKVASGAMKGQPASPVTIALLNRLEALS